MMIQIFQQQLQEEHETWVRTHLINLLDKPEQLGMWDLTEAGVETLGTALKIERKQAITDRVDAERRQAKREKEKALDTLRQVLRQQHETWIRTHLISVLDEPTRWDTWELTEAGMEALGTALTDERKNADARKEQVGRQT